MLEVIIEMEDRFINSKRRLPKVIKMNYQTYCKLIREMETNRFLNTIHGIKIMILPINKIVIE